MLGIFDINMTPIYGEGKRAFFRLQEEIIKTCNDHTIFCWEWTDDVPKDWASLLAPWPTVYKGSGEYEQLNSDEISVFSMTNAGLSIRLPVITAFGASHITASSWFVMLQAAPAASATLKHLEVACLSVMGRRVGDFLYVTRLSYPPQPMTISRAYAPSFKTESLIVMDRLSYPSRPMHLSRAGESLVMNRFTPGGGSRKMKGSTDVSDDNTVTFIPIFDSPRLQGRWDFHDLYGSDISPRSMLSAITLTTDADNIGVAAISITRAGRNPDPEFYILLGVEKREDSCYATAKLVEAREGDLAWDSEGLEKTMTQWRQRVTAGRSAISGAYYNKSLELTMVLGRSTDVIRTTRNYYFLCFYEGDVAYNVARMARWICALETEYVAAQTSDPNEYTLGRMGHHNVVIAVLSDGYGTSSAASVATHMIFSFLNIRIGLLVGIAGGSPSIQHDIRLGDVVVSTPGNGHNGVLPYDMCVAFQGQEFEIRRVLDAPPFQLLAAANGLRSQHDIQGHSDRLHFPHVVHPSGQSSHCVEHCGSYPSTLVLRPERTDAKNGIVIHYGLIASGNTLCRDANLRDKFAQKVEPGTEVLLRERWAAQIQEAVGQLHDARIV
ncbi:hypothetical protein BKA60DRAFT_594054 [Fusarium oxysporum]|nr:hypothetical protein BKA60DRAFT_594054 [Fusarium oxysporum]